MRKIILMHTGTSYSGIDVYLANVVKLLSGDAQLQFFCSNPKTRARLAALGAKDVTNYATLGRVLSLVLFALYMPALRYRMRIDTFWVQGGFGTLLLPWARLLGFRTVLTRHSAMNIEALGGLRGLKHQAMEAISWRLMRFAQRVICVSETVAEGVRRIVPDERVSAIPNWVPLPSLKNKHVSSDNGLNVLFVGRLERFKGGHLLIKALGKLNARREIPISLTVVGDGQFRSEMEQLASGLPTEFVGFQADPTPYYELADIFVNPSTNPCEGMPLTSLEAMSHGLPCILSDIPQNREIVGNRASALLFRNGNVEDLVAKLELCVQASESVRDLGACARKSIAERFSPQIANSQYLQALAQI